VLHSVFNGWGLTVDIYILVIVVVELYFSCSVVVSLVVVVKSQFSCGVVVSLGVTLLSCSLSLVIVQS